MAMMEGPCAADARVLRPTPSALAVNLASRWRPRPPVLDSSLRPRGLPPATLAPRALIVSQGHARVVAFAPPPSKSARLLEPAPEHRYRTKNMEGLRPRHGRASPAAYYARPSNGPTKPRAASPARPRLNSAAAWPGPRIPRPPWPRTVPEEHARVPAFAPPASMAGRRRLFNPID